MLRVPLELEPYVDFKENQIIAVNLPNNLKEEYMKLKKQYEEFKEKNELTDF